MLSSPFSVITVPLSLYANNYTVCNTCVCIWSLYAYNHSTVTRVCLSVFPCDEFSTILTDHIDFCCRRCTSLFALCCNWQTNDSLHNPVSPILKNRNCQYITCWTLKCLDIFIDWEWNLSGVIFTLRKQPNCYNFNVMRSNILITLRDGWCQLFPTNFTMNL